MTVNKQNKERMTVGLHLASESPLMGNSLFSISNSYLLVAELR